MNKYILIEDFLTDYPLVSFYTVRIETNDLSETEKFIERFSDTPELREDFETIITWIDKMGTDFGAQRIFFRDENGANALPPRRGILEKYTPTFVEFAQLRLYCIRLSDQIVILLNGGVKTSEKVQDSPDCIAHFRFAVRFCKLLDEQIRDRTIRIKGLKLDMDEPGFFF